MSASLLNWLGDDTSGEILPAEKKTKNTENSRAKSAAPRKTARSKKTDETEHTVQKDSELKSEYTADPDYVPTLTDVRISARKIECVSDELRRSICVDLEGTRSSLEELKKICSDRSGDVKLQSSLAELKKICSDRSEDVKLQSSLAELKKICSDRSGDVKLQSSLAELKKICSDRSEDVKLQSSLAELKKICSDRSCAGSQKLHLETLNHIGSMLKNIMEGSRTETLTEIKAAHIEIGKLRESIDRCHPEPTGRNQLINGIDIDTVFPYLSAVPELLKKIYSMDMLFEIAKGELPHLSERIHRLFSVSEKRLSKCKNEEQEEYVIHDISVQFDRLKASIVNLISCESDSKPDETENTSLRYRRMIRNMMIVLPPCILSVLYIVNGSAV
jgi:hypothetical protein